MGTEIRTRELLVKSCFATSLPDSSFRYRGASMVHAVPRQHRFKYDRSVPTTLTKRLDEELPSWQDETVFQWDNAPYHTSQETKAVIQSLGL